MMPYNHDSQRVVPGPTLSASETCQTCIFLSLTPDLLNQKGWGSGRSTICVLTSPSSNYDAQLKFEHYCSYKTPWYLDLINPGLHYTPTPHPTPATLASFQPCEYTKSTPTSAPLYLLFPLPQTATQVALSLTSGLFSDVILLSEAPSQPPTMLVSQGCHYNVPQTGWLKTDIYSPTVLEARGPKSRCQQRHVASETLDRILSCLLPLASSGGHKSLLPFGL